jgi:hypothetical protein
MSLVSDIPAGDGKIVIFFYSVALLLYYLRHLSESICYTLCLIVKEYAAEEGNKS